MEALFQIAYRGYDTEKIPYEGGVYFKGNMQNWARPAKITT